MKEQTQIERFSSGNGEGLYNDDNGYWVRFEDVEQYAELRIQQEREKWKEETKKEVLEALEMEVIKIATDLQYQMFIITSNPQTAEDLECAKIEAFNRSKDYYETEVKPRIESK